MYSGIPGTEDTGRNRPSIMGLTKWRKSNHVKECRLIDMG